MWPEMYPADAHDAPLLPGQMRAVTGADGFATTRVQGHVLPSCLVKCVLSLGQIALQHLECRGPCGRKCTQLMLMMLPSCLVKCTQSRGQMVLQHLESRGAMWPEMYPADAHDAPLLPGQTRAITGADAFATSRVQGHVLPSCLVKCAQSLGQMVLQHLESSCPCGWRCTQLMLMMLPSCLVKCAQSLGQMDLQTMRPEMYPPDAHDSPLLPGKMRAMTGADGFATPGV